MEAPSRTTACRGLSGGSWGGSGSPLEGTSLALTPGCRWVRAGRSAGRQVLGSRPSHSQKKGLWPSCSPAEPRGTACRGFPVPVLRQHAMACRDERPERGCVLPGAMAQAKHAAPAPLGCQESPGQRERAREGQAAAGHGSKREQWLRALQAQCPEGPQAAQIPASIPLPLQPVLSAAWLCSQSSPFPRASLSPFGSGHRDPGAWAAPLPAPILVRQGGCRGQVFCKRQICATPGAVPGRSGAGRAGLCPPCREEGWRAASVWPSGSCCV